MACPFFTVAFVRPNLLSKSSFLLSLKFYCEGGPSYFASAKVRCVFLSKEAFHFSSVCFSFRRIVPFRLLKVFLPLTRSFLSYHFSVLLLVVVFEVLVLTSALWFLFRRCFGPMCSPFPAEYRTLVFLFFFFVLRLAGLLIVLLGGSGVSCLGSFPFLHKRAFATTSPSHSRDSDGKTME